MSQSIFVPDNDDRRKKDRRDWRSVVYDGQNEVKNNRELSANWRDRRYDSIDTNAVGVFDTFEFANRLKKQQDKIISNVNDDNSANSSNVKYGQDPRFKTGRIPHVEGLIVAAQNMTDEEIIKHNNEIIDETRSRYNRKDRRLNK